MISYKDKTFCNSDCKNWECDRYIDHDFLWKESERFGLPVAYADFSENCKDYKDKDSRYER